MCLCKYVCRCEQLRMYACTLRMQKLSKFFAVKLVSKQNTATPLRSVKAVERCIAENNEFISIIVN